MRKATKPEIRTVKKGKRLVEQGDAGDELFLLLDGVLAVIDRRRAVAEVGPGAILGERAVLEGGIRTVDARGDDRVQGRGRVAPTRSTAPRSLELAREAIAERRDRPE